MVIYSWLIDAAVTAGICYISLPDGHLLRQASCVTPDMPSRRRARPCWCRNAITLFAFMISLLTGRRRLRLEGEMPFGRISIYLCPPSPRERRRVVLFSAERPAATHHRAE